MLIFVQANVQAPLIDIQLLEGPVDTPFVKLIQGTVRDKDSKQKLEEVNIRYQRGIKHSHTASNGTFSVQPGMFPDTLLMSRVGYLDQTYILKDAESPIEIDMRKNEVQLSQIQVDAFNGSKTLSRVDLNKIPVNSAQDLLRKVPGLFIAQHAGGGKAEQIFLRGFDNDHGTDIAVSADGIPVNMGYQ